jgi:hypothetical protein
MKKTKTKDFWTVVSLQKVIALAKRHDWCIDIESKGRVSFLFNAKGGDVYAIDWRNYDGAPSHARYIQMAKGALLDDAMSTLTPFMFQGSMLIDFVADQLNTDEEQAIRDRLETEASHRLAA